MPADYKKDQQAKDPRSKGITPEKSEAVLKKLQGKGIHSTQDYNANRVPWILTCKKWMQGSVARYIYFNVNPAQVNWNMPLRASIQKQRMGRIMHIWRNKFRGTFFDEPTLDITFRTGSILTHITTSNKEYSVSNGLYNFGSFIDLMDEQKIMDDGTFNTIYLTYNSLLFPKLQLEGFFDPQSFSFTDNTSETPNIEWSAKFIIMHTIPSLTKENLIGMVDSVHGGKKLPPEWLT
jgi:hypothetical protein